MPSEAVIRFNRITLKCDQADARPRCTHEGLSHQQAARSGLIFAMSDGSPRCCCSTVLSRLLQTRKMASGPASAYNIDADIRS